MENVRSLYPRTLNYLSINLKASRSLRDPYDEWLPLFMSTHLITMQIDQKPAICFKSLSISMSIVHLDQAIAIAPTGTKCGCNLLDTAGIFI
ncbi:hypothetical protein [Phormidium nigroviride]